MSSDKTEVKLAIYDSNRNFLGYISGGSGEISRDERKALVHPMERVRKNSPLIHNLLVIMNQELMGGGKPRSTPYSEGTFNDDRTFYVVPKPAEGRATNGDKLAEIAIQKESGAMGKYYIAEMPKG